MKNGRQTEETYQGKSCARFRQNCQVILLVRNRFSSELRISQFSLNNKKTILRVFKFSLFAFP